MTPPRAPSRVYLRAPEPRDADALTALARASRRFHAGWVAPPRDAAQFERYLARSAGDDFDALLVCRSDDDAPLGVINLSQIVRGLFRNAYLGYWIAAPYAGQGYMSEGLARALDRAFGPLGLHRLEANIQPRNAASKRLAERLGFRLEGYSPRYLKIGGRWRDHERWAILREEWKARRGRVPSHRRNDR